MKIKTALIVSSFPSEDSPSRGVFNKRAAEQLSEYANVTVIHLRFLKPGRKIAHKVQTGKYKHITLSVPYFPFFEQLLLGPSIDMYRIAGNLKIKDELSGVDILHSVGASVAGILASKWSAQYKKHHLLQIIGTDINTELPRLTNKSWFPHLKKWTHGVGCNSAALKEAYERLMGRTRNIEVIYRGIDTNKFKPLAGKNTSTPVFLFLGGIPFYKSVMNTRNLKGGMTLMNVWKDNEEYFESKNARLIFGGPDSNSPTADEWRAKLKYPGNVTLTGALTPEDVLGKLTESNIVLIPSLEEGMPNVLLEAAASGKCVIASEVGGIPELVKQNETGLLVKPGDESSLKAAMEKIVNEPGTMEALGKNARDIVAAKFDSSNFAKKYFELYKALLNEPLG